MATSFKYWDDCVDAEDMEAMWMDPDVSKEWIDAGETKGRKVHLSRDPDGQPYLTQTEMKAVADIIVHRHFRSQIDQDMICAVAEIASDRQPLSERYNKKTKETSIGLMQITPSIAERMVSEMGYRMYEIEGNSALLHRPFINVYLGAAYLKWLLGYDGKERTEEFVIRAYKGGTKKATHKSTLDYWNRYLSVKQSLPSKRKPANYEDHSSVPDSSGPSGPALMAGDKFKYWDSVASPKDMEDLWKNPEVLKEWTKSGERQGKVRFSLDEEKRPYLSRIEVKAIAEIIISRHFFNSRGINSASLCALAELSSMRFVNGVGPRSGIMGIDYPTALWLHNDGNNAYQAKSVDDLSNPFLSMYFGVAYLIWLSNYEGRERDYQFIVQAYLGRPENVDIQETGPLWVKFQETLSLYGDSKKEQSGCSIL